MMLLIQIDQKPLMSLRKGRQCFPRHPIMAECPKEARGRQFKLLPSFASQMPHHLEHLWKWKEGNLNHLRSQAMLPWGSLPWHSI